MVEMPHLMSVAYTVGPRPVNADGTAATIGHCLAYLFFHNKVLRPELEERYGAIFFTGYVYSRTLLCFGIFGKRFLDKELGLRSYIFARKSISARLISARSSICYILPAHKQKRILHNY